jgi:glutathionylspermidine synthase
MDYAEFAQRLYQTGMLSDPWVEGRQRFSSAPQVIEGRQLDEMYMIGERVTQLVEEMAEIVREEPALLDRYFHLTPWQKMMWLSAEGRWHGIARVDLFHCSDGRWQVCEINSDTPSGEAEAILLNRIVGQMEGVEGLGLRDPNRDVEERFWEMLVASDRSTRGEVARPERIGILYPTDQPEDLSLVALYRSWFEKRGCRVVLGSPYNLGLASNGCVTLIDEPIDLLVRHYKTDWWGEREVIWSNQEAYPDPDPLERELSLLLAAERAGRVTVVNPFGAIVAQNKLSLAFIWEHRASFSPESRQWIEDYLPETHRLIDLDPASLKREEWVIKSVYGCEGDSVIVGPFVTAEVWNQAIEHLVPRQWIAQRYFEVASFKQPSGQDDEYPGWRPNHGVFIIAGRAAGIYTRLSPQATDYRAITVPIFTRSSII